MSEKIITRGDLNNILNELFPFDNGHKQYIKNVFESDMGNGLTETEFKRKLESIKYNPTDETDMWDVEHVKKALLNKIGK